MIGAEIVALVALVLGAGLGWRSLDRWSKARRERKKHDDAQEEKMRAEMRAALEAKGHAAIDEFLVLWDFRLSKEERRQLDKIREDRYVSEEP